MTKKAKSNELHDTITTEVINNTYYIVNNFLNDGYCNRHNNTNYSIFILYKRQKMFATIL